MASTLQNLFPFTDKKARDFVVYPCHVKFSAPIRLGHYVFSATTTPPVYFGKLLQKQTGVIAGVKVSANCSEEQFTRALSDSLKLQILHGGNRTPVNLAPFPFCNFSQAEEFTLQWSATGTTMTQEEKFLLSVTGEVEQLTGMTLNELELNVVFNFIRVGTDKIDG